MVTKKKDAKRPFFYLQHSIYNILYVYTNEGTRMAKLTRAEFYEKYKNIRFKFIYYEKYKFIFEGYDLDNQRIIIECGGNSDEVYQIDVSAGVEYSIHDLTPYSGQSFVDTFYDY